MNPNISPGSVLGGQVIGCAHTPGPVGLLVGNFDFKVDLGLVADFVSLDVFYSVHEPPAELTLNGYDDQGQLISASTLAFSGYFFFEETSISIPSTSPEITWIELVASNTFAGYDNILALPDVG